ncbi:MAG: MAPEG family protein [Devosia sp.]
MNGYAYALIGAVLAQGAIAIVLVYLLGSIRVPMVASGKMKMRDIALSREPWPEHEKKVANAFDNQFQLPVLFYVGCGLSLYFGTIWIEVIVAWLFVLTRVVHAVVFATTNRVQHRFFWYTAGLGILTFFWLELIARLVFFAIWNRV